MQAIALTCGFARRIAAFASTIPCPRTPDSPMSYDAHERDARLSRVLDELVC
jgi:hypothetical protein